MLSKKSFRWFTVGAGLGLAGAWVWRHQGEVTARRPLNEWTFSHLDRLMPTAPVPAHSPTPLRVGTPLTLADVTYHYDGRRALSALVSRCYLTSIVVTHHGKIVLEAYPGRFATPSRRFHWFSFSHVILSALAAIAQERDQFPRNTSVVCDVLPELTSTPYGDVPLAELARMTGTSGISGDRAAADALNQRFERAALGGGSLLDVIRTAQPCGVSGTRPSTALLDAQVLSWALERTTDTPLAEYAAHTLWGPMGAELSAYYALSRGVPRRALGGWGLNATTRDMARFGQLVAQRGRNAAGTQVIPERWITEHVAAAPATDEHRLWYSPSPGVLTGTGSHGQFLRVDRETDSVVAVTSAWPQPHDDRRSAEMHQAGRDIARFLTKGTP